MQAALLLERTLSQATKEQEVEPERESDGEDHPNQQYQFHLRELLFTGLAQNGVKCLLQPFSV